MFWRDSGEVVEGLVDAGGQAGGGDVVTQDALVDNMGEETRLGYQFLEQVRNIFPALGGEGFLVAGTAPEGDDDGFAFLLRDGATHQRAGAEQRTRPDLRWAASRRNSRRLRLR